MQEKNVYIDIIGQVCYYLKCHCNREGSVPNDKGCFYATINNANLILLHSISSAMRHNYCLNKVHITFMRKLMQILHKVKAQVKSPLNQTKDQRQTMVGM